MKYLFPLFWSDDIELCVFWECEDKIGNLFHSGINACYEFLPFSQYLSRHDPKVFQKRALFEQTARERKLLIESLLKSQPDSFPVRVLLEAPTKAVLEKRFFYLH